MKPIGKHISAINSTQGLWLKGNGQMKAAAGRTDRSAVVLSGGEGRHLRRFVHQFLHQDLPKQYVAFIGTRSMLTHTYDRAERLVQSDRIYTVLGHNHLRHDAVQKQVAFRAPHTLLSEPMSKGTGPGLLLPLLHIQKNHPKSIVAVLPSDHFIREENLFLAYLEEAFEIVEKSPSKIVFLGAEPETPEPEYGYILPDFESKQPDSRIHSILAFAEEPDLSMAAKLISFGALWNTSIMVFHVETMIDLLRLSVPRLYRAFQRISRALGTPYETSTVEAVYEDLEPTDFCKDIIRLCDVYSKNQFSVMPMRNVFWSDWGCAIRIRSVLDRLNYLDRIACSPNVSGDFVARIAQPKLAVNL